MKSVLKHVLGCANLKFINKLISLNNDLDGILSHLIIITSVLIVVHILFSYL